MRKEAVIHLQRPILSILRIVLAIAAGLLLASACGDGDGLGDSTPETTAPVEATATSEVDAPTEEPTEPAATERIAFTSDRDGNQEIYVMNADGSGQTRLTNNSVDDYDPAWSPDGTKIAFTTNRDDPDPSTCVDNLPPICETQVYVMDADGSNQTRISNVPGELAFSPAWSHDGTKIAFTATRQGILSISTMNPDGSGVTRVTDNPPGSFIESDLDPAWSPDDLQLVFWGLPRSRMGFSAIFIINVDGSNLGRLTFPAGLVFNVDKDPAWSPDGSRIAYSSGDPGGTPEPLGIYVMNADGSGQTRLTDNPANDSSPAWSPAP